MVCMGECVRGHVVCIVACVVHVVCIVAYVVRVVCMLERHTLFKWRVFVKILSIANGSIWSTIAVAFKSSYDTFVIEQISLNEHSKENIKRESECECECVCM